MAIVPRHAAPEILGGGYEKVQHMVSRENFGRNAGLSRRSILTSLIAAPFVMRSHFGFAQSADALTVRVDFAPWGVHGALHLSQVKGWMKESGLQIDLQDGAGTLSTINLVAAGQIDVGFVQLGPMAIAASAGLPVTSFSGYLRRCDLAVLVDAEKGPKTAKDLAGKKIVCFANSPWAPFIDGYLKRIGLERGTAPNQVNIVMVSPTAMVSTYASGDADGFMSLKPFGEPLVKEVRPARSFLAADAGIVFPSYGLIATRDTLNKKKEVLRRLSANQSRSWTYIAADAAHSVEAAAAIITNRPDKQLKPEVLQTQASLCRDFIETENTKGKPIGWQSDADWKLAVKSMSDAGLVKPDVRVEDFFTNDLVCCMSVGVASVGRTMSAAADESFIKPYVSISNVTKAYDSADTPILALKDIDLDIAPGEFVSIVGPSGCGKSTLLKCVAGLQPVTTGAITVKGAEIKTPPDNMAIVFQRDVLLDWRTVLDNVLLTAEFRGLRRADYLDRAMTLLKSYGLGDFANRFPWELSGGMRQRTAICRALLVDPELLLMDEPFGALDAMTRDDLNVELERLWYATRKTLLFITHGIEEAVYLSDRVVVMAGRPGRIAEIVKIEIPRPRPLSVRQTPEFGKYAAHIRHLFASLGLVKAE